MAIKNAPDLTQRPPRSPRVRLGGFVILPRMLDKGRATVVGKHGEYHYNCPMDQRLLSFLGVKADALRKQLAAGKGDAEVLQWIQKNGKHNPRNRKSLPGPHTRNNARRQIPNPANTHGLHAKIAPKREDIATWFTCSTWMITSRSAAKPELRRIAGW